MMTTTLIAEVDEAKVKLRCECPGASCTYWVWIDCKAYNDDFSHWGHVVHPRCKPGHKGFRVAQSFPEFDVVTVA
jgi:hypothetical protein